MPRKKSVKKTKPLLRPETRDERVTVAPFLSVAERAVLEGDTLGLEEGRLARLRESLTRQLDLPDVQKALRTFRTR